MYSQILVSNSYKLTNIRVTVCPSTKSVQNFSCLIVFIAVFVVFHYENMPVQIYRKSPPKTENFQIKNSDIFHISAQNVDCGYTLEPPRQGGSSAYPQSMFLSRNKKKMYIPVNPGFTI